MRIEERKLENVYGNRRKIMSHISGKDTSIEISLRKDFLHKEFRYHKKYGSITFLMG